MVSWNRHARSIAKLEKICKPMHTEFSISLSVFWFSSSFRHSVMRRLKTGIRSEKYVVRRFRRYANVIECTYTNLDSIAYYTPRLYGVAYCSQATNLDSMLLYWILQAIVTQWYYNIMGPPSYMRSVVDRNVGMQRMTVCWRTLYNAVQGPVCKPG
jgi:hypothetical protein